MSTPAAARCGPECERAVVIGIRAFVRIFTTSASWWLIGFLGALAVGGTLWWSWEWIRDWWGR